MRGTRHRPPCWSGWPCGARATSGKAPGPRASGPTTCCTPCSIMNGGRADGTVIRPSEQWTSRDTREVHRARPLRVTGAAIGAGSGEERHSVERGEALGIGEVVALGLYAHHAVVLDEQPAVGGVAQVNL